MQGHRIGYVHVSSFDQNPERQLEHVQVAKVFTDKSSGKDTQRPQLNDAHNISLLQLRGHWGVATLRLEEAYINTLDQQVMA